MNRLVLSIPADHPAFAGHFPGRPIVPGVVLLDQAQSLLATATQGRIRGISMAKFLSPVSPGEALWLDYEINAGGVRVEICAADRKVASARFVLREPAA